MNRVLIIFTLFMCVCIFAYVAKSKNVTGSHSPILEEIRSNFSKLNPKYSEIPLREGDSAYTEDKEVITLCLVDPETKRNYDINTLMYVSIHELAHVVSQNEGHGEEFKKNFASLLKQGANLGIYNPRKPIPATYCKVVTGK